MHLDDLTDQALLTYAYHVKHVGITHTGSDDQRSRHFFNRAFTHLNGFTHFLLFYRLLLQTPVLSLPQADLIEHEGSTSMCS